MELDLASRTAGWRINMAAQFDSWLIVLQLVCSRLTPADTARITYAAGMTSRTDTLIQLSHCQFTALNQAERAYFEEVTVNAPLFSRI